MRQTAVNEKIDPLMRIQQEIQEVERREQEYRRLISSTSTMAVGENENHESSDDQHNDSLQSLSPVPPVNTSLNSNEDCNSNMPSLALSVNSIKDEDHHSDDSGISASSSPVNGVSANIKKLNEAATKPQTANQTVTAPSTPLPAKEHRYIGPNCYALTPEPPQQKLMTRTVSTPLLSAIKAPRQQFTMSPAHKGVMQRFIASRGKLQLNNSLSSPSHNNSNKIFLNGNNAVAVLGLNSPSAALNTPPNTPMTPATALLGNASTTQPDFAIRSPIVPSVILSPPQIERDSEGRPIRPGYVPVEVKIQRELQDLKTRESELKKIRKIRQSTPDLLDSIENELADSDSDDSEVEHCYGPGKLRAAKSIGDMCDSAHNSSSNSLSPIPDYDKQQQQQRGGMRPAVSLAQLCEMDPEETPSSKGLIAQWENLIQQNA
ncbi:probable basic-leucine zipper transcription factor H [Musca vetustissima]|uniref:probable basic-leucine zipper transcription factor H n=1 Tax=Musca vetustissima TaxID=27455 RepID=UPI002AB7618B|nr:probable basic-leucine zipper transcription factor H [Musca vetustissima]